jgi:crotonobetainyl-CoA:carnitine CoA-transferase CaiB-like acyl-CoA transferase
MFAIANLMKRSCVVDIAQPEGQRLCHGLVARSDVVVANFRPGVLEQFGMDYASLRAINPGIIVATITGYGYTGAYAAFQALGPNIHAFSGLSASTGYSGGPPEQLFGTYGDIVAGQVTVLSILAALRHRSLTGEGQFIDTAMSEAVVAVAPEPALRAALGIESHGRRGNDEDGIAPHGCYPTVQDDRWIAIAAFDDREWAALAATLGLDELVDDARFASKAARYANRAELDALLRQATRSWRADELSAQLQASGLAAAPVRTAEDVFADEQLIGDGFIGTVTQSELGEATLPKLPWRLSVGEESPRPIGPAPGFGEDTRKILQELLSVSDDEWDSLVERGIVA